MRRDPLDRTTPEPRWHVERALQLANAPTGSTSPVRPLQPRSSPASNIPTDAWSALREAKVPNGQIDANRLVSLMRSDPAYHAFDILRTRVVQTMRANGWKKLAITSPTPECGKTMVAVNLAFSLARQGDCKTMLVDLDLRRPRIADMLGIAGAASMEALLSGKSDVGSTFLRFGQNLAVAAGKHLVELPAELLQSESARQVISHVETALAPDIMIFDLPPMLSSDDVASFLPNVDCAILIAGAGQSTRAEIDLCERQLGDSVGLLGIVLNKCQFTPDRYGY